MVHLRSTLKNFPFHHSHRYQRQPTKVKNLVQWASPLLDWCTRSRASISLQSPPNNSRNEECSRSIPLILPIAGIHSYPLPPNRFLWGREDSYRAFGINKNVTNCINITKSNIVINNNNLRSDFCQMPAGGDSCGGSNNLRRSHREQGLKKSPSDAATVTPFSVSSLPLSLVNAAWSVLILLVLGTQHGGSGLVPRYGTRNAFRAGRGRSCRGLQRLHLPGNWGGLLLLPTMSGYSALFSDAFHPEASHPSDDKTSENENNNKSNNSAKSRDHGNESTCEADASNNSGTPHPEEDQLLLFHYDSTTSTQDEAKRIAKRLSENESSSSVSTFCVTTASQSSGRGTTGRQWLGAPGNVFVTIGFPMQTYMTTMLRERRIPLTLLPLKIGDLTASLVRSELDDENCAAVVGDASGPARVTVKWPNDVLVDGKKISGTLIESSSDWFLVGIGINVAHAPTVPTTGKDYGRPSVSLHEYCGPQQQKQQQQSDDDAITEAAQIEHARDLGVGLALGIHRWIQNDPSEKDGTAESIVEGWKRWLDWDAELTLRNDNDADQSRRKTVRLVDVLPDGRIRVRHKGSGKEEVLVSDYFV